jgi:hypothetical protein
MGKPAVGLARGTLIGDIGLMGFSAIRFQTSYFASAGEITPSPKHLMKLLPAIEKRNYLASTMAEVGGQSSMPVPLVNRLRLTSESGDFGINFLSKRIDIELSIQVGARAGIQQLAEFLVNAEEDLKNIVGVFPIKAQRLAVVAKYIFDEMDEKSLLNAQKKLLNTPAYFEKCLPFEWNWRAASSTEINLNGSTEPCNTILSVARASGEFLTKNQETQHFDRIIFDIDINTKQEKLDVRFGPEHLEPFFKHSIDFHQHIATELEQIIA